MGYVLLWTFLVTSAIIAVGLLPYLFGYLIAASIRTAKRSSGVSTGARPAVADYVPKQQPKPSNKKTSFNNEESASQREVTAPGKHTKTSYEEIECEKTPDNADVISDFEMQALASYEANKQAEADFLRRVEESVYG